MSKHTFPPMAHRLPELRLTVAACYYAHLLNQNDSAWYQDDKHRVRMEVSPDVIAIAIQNNIEGALLKTYGQDEGEQNAAVMLTAMICSGGLSDFGITVMDELFSSLAGIASESLSQGRPISATMNQPVH